MVKYHVKNTTVTNVCYLPR